MKYRRPLPVKQTKSPAFDHAVIGRRHMILAHGIFILISYLSAGILAVAGAGHVLGYGPRSRSRIWLVGVPVDNRRALNRATRRTKCSGSSTTISLPASARFGSSILDGRKCMFSPRLRGSTSSNEARISMAAIYDPAFGFPWPLRSRMRPRSRQGRSCTAAISTTPHFLRPRRGSCRHGRLGTFDFVTVYEGYPNGSSTMARSGGIGSRSLDGWDTGRGRGG
jgi:hypothetical protein